ncbi:hypothetical protein NW762_001919 [Fusarium torreyae]|uniref:Uncharacterized protein n=1 Tax=Fusarium torreyae TaxID=1237075 RepID=A0A9W8VKA9_9HYPO|nr:hypothetical protein NW762_001919 [Fusarium torreyae]
MSPSNVNSSNVSIAGTPPSSRPRSPQPENPPAGGIDQTAFNNFQFTGHGSSPTPANDPLKREIHVEWQKSAQLKPRMEHKMPKGP